MTSNQIANESNNIRQRELDETNRHNLATEENADRLTTLQELTMQREYEYQTERNRIQKEYNDAYLEYQKASTDRKLELEAQMNALAELKAYNEDNWNQQRNAIAAEEAATHANQAAEIVRHNKETESIATNANWIAQQRLTFDKYALNENLGIKSRELTQEKEIATLQMQNQYNIAKKRAQSDMITADRDRSSREKIATSDRWAETARTNARLRSAESIADKDRESNEKVQHERNLFGLGGTLLHETGEGNRSFVNGITRVLGTYFGGR